MSKKNDKIVLSKWNSAGNTFLVLKGGDVFKKNRKKFTIKYCDSISGLKADGCLFLDPMKSKTFYIWDFYNADGSTAEMCGNAARAAHQYCRLFLKDNGKTLQFKTLAGIVKTTEAEKKISVEMPEIKILKNDKNRLIVNTGVPHIVIQVKELSRTQKDLKKLKKLRHLSFGGQKGFNVTLLELNSRIRINAVTFERGVESFTPSCGTGAVAAAVYFNIKRKTLDKNTKIKIAMPGGDLWVIGKSSHFQLRGETELICKAEVNL